jgi:hypothetical protein
MLFSEFFKILGSNGVPAIILLRQTNRCGAKLFVLELRTKPWWLGRLKLFFEKSKFRIPHVHTSKKIVVNSICTLQMVCYRFPKVNEVHQLLRFSLSRGTLLEE